MIRPAGSSEASFSQPSGNRTAQPPTSLVRSSGYRKTSRPGEIGAKLCIKMSEHPEAFDRLLESRPNDALLWYIRAEHHLLKRDYQAAVADFARGGEPPATMEFAYVYATALLLSSDLSSYREYVVRQAERLR